MLSTAVWDAVVLKSRRELNIIYSVEFWRRQRGNEHRGTLRDQTSRAFIWNLLTLSIVSNPCCHRLSIWTLNSKCVLDTDQRRAYVKVIFPGRLHERRWTSIDSYLPPPTSLLCWYEMILTRRLIFTYVNTVPCDVGLFWCTSLDIAFVFVIDLVSYDDSNDLSLEDMHKWQV